MTAASLANAYAVCLLVSLVVGWMARLVRIEPTLSATWAFVAACVVALPCLLFDRSTMVQRLIQPREAVDWLPMFLLALASAEALSARPRMTWFGGVLGGLVCFGIGFRLLWGSVYLRSGQWQWLMLASIGLWGIAIGTSWWMFRRWSDRVPLDSRRLARAIAWELFLLAIAVVLAMSGSLTYAAVAGCLAVGTLGSWLTTGRIAPTGSAAAGCMLGLGVAFAELSLGVAVSMGLAVGLFAFTGSCERPRFRLACSVVAIMLMLISSAIVTQQFLKQLSAKPETNGYEAYK